MNNFQLTERVEFLKTLLQDTGAKGFIVGNSGGKDCSLVLYLASRATKNVLGVMMPCGTSINYGQDLADAKALAEWAGFENILVDVTPAREALVGEMGKIGKTALANIAPRLRMTTLYAIGQERGYLVLGTGNASERAMGYFTKFGDGACDANPIADLPVASILAALKSVGCPSSITSKAPSAGLYEGQTDESEMGVKYEQVEQFLDYLKTGNKKDIETSAFDKMAKMHATTRHKRELPTVFKG